MALKQRIAQLETISGHANSYDDVRPGDINADWLINECRSLYNQCRKRGDFVQANRCLDIMGKHTQNYKTENNFSSLSDEQLEAEVIGLCDKLGFAIVRAPARK